MILIMIEFLLNVVLVMIPNVLCHGLHLNPRHIVTQTSEFVIILPLFVYIVGGWIASRWLLWLPHSDNLHKEPKQNSNSLPVQESIFDDINHEIDKPILSSSTNDMLTRFIIIDNFVLWFVCG